MAKQTQSPFIRKHPKYGPEVVHLVDCVTCDGVGSLEISVFWSAGRTRTVSCDDCYRGTAEVLDCDCAACTDLWEEAGLACGCGRCDACRVLACNSLGPITLEQHEAVEESKAETLRWLALEEEAKQPQRPFGGSVVVEVGT